MLVHRSPINAASNLSVLLHPKSIFFADSYSTSRASPGFAGRPKAKADCLRPSRLAVLANLLRLLLWFSCDRNLNVSTLFELHIIAMFVS